MIDPKELRLGNLVYDGMGNVVPIEGISPGRVHSKMELTPIPLTEEWLLRFGFKLFPWGWVKDNVLIKLNKHNIYSLEVGNGLRAYGEYVHQLQNLYFVLTGKELELKEPVK